MGYKLAVGWVSRPYAESDVSIGGCYLAAAGDTGRDDADVAALLKYSSGGAGTTPCGE